MSNQLPTKPGHYWWREKEAHMWEVGEVYRGFDGRLYFQMDIAVIEVERAHGQWSHIPTPDEGNWEMKDLDQENRILQHKAKTLDACLIKLQKAQQRIAELEAKCAAFDKEVDHE